MKTNKKFISLSLTSLLVVGLLLSMAVGALAADPAVLRGVLVKEAGVNDWSVKGTTFTVVGTTSCTLLASTSCGDLAANMLVEVETDGFNATKITQLTGAETFTYEGVAVAIDNTPGGHWVVDTVDFLITASTTFPVETTGVGDTVVITYKLSTDPVTLGEYEAVSIILKNSVAGKTYTYTGALSAASGEAWTITGASGALDFHVPTSVQPPFFAPGDMVDVTYTIVSGVREVSAVTITSLNGEYSYTGEVISAPSEGFEGDWEIGDFLFTCGDGCSVNGYESLFDEFGVFIPGATATVTFMFDDPLNPDSDKLASLIDITEVPEPTAAIKNPTNRCGPNNERDFTQVDKIVQRLNQELGADLNYDWVKNYFCAGYGFGEIKQAYQMAAKLDAGSFCVADLLTLRSEGYGWGNIKKLASCSDLPKNGKNDDSTDDETTSPETQDQSIKPAKQDKPVNENKPDKDNKPEKSNNSNKSNSETKSNNGKAKGKDK